MIGLPSVEFQRARTRMSRAFFFSYPFLLEGKSLKIAAKWLYLDRDHHQSGDGR